MFSTALRRRAVWQSVGPVLMTCTRWKFSEHPGLSNDLLIPLVAAHQTLHVNLITTNELDAFCMDETHGHGHANHKEHHSLLVLLSVDSKDGVLGLSKMQIWQFSQHDLRPLILVSSPERLLSHLTTYVDNLKQASKYTVSPKPNVTEVISMTTFSTPSKLLTPTQASAVTHICHSVRGLDHALRTHEGYMEISKYLDEATLNNMTEFWTNERIV